MSEPTVDLRELGHRALLRTVDDLWSAVTATQIKDLRPETVEVAKMVHQIVWHEGEPQ